MTALPSRSSAPDGGLVIWKPRGPTSRAIINQVQVRLDFKGLGHCGTLDPMASGVLVIIGGAGRRFQLELRRFTPPPHQAQPGEARQEER